MKTYRVEFAVGPFTLLGNLFLILVLCLTGIGAPLGIAMFPTLYRIVEE